MKETFENERRVIEYNYEDWWNGLFDGILIGDVKNTNTGQTTYYTIKIEEIDKIKLKQKELYWKAVEDKLNYLIARFKEKHERSEEKELLIKFEIDGYDKLLDENKLPLPNYRPGEQLNSAILRSLNEGWKKVEIPGLHFGESQIYHIRKIYFTLIIEGNRNYSKIQSPNLQVNNRQNYFTEIEVEAIYKYTKWLKEFPKSETHTIAYNAPTLREIALYYIYNGIEVNKANENELLKRFNQKAGSKLKQHYEYYRSTANRINIDTDRKNKYRIKEFKNVISMLKKEQNSKALHKAEDEFLTFRNKLL